MSTYSVFVNCRSFRIQIESSDLLVHGTHIYFLYRYGKPCLPYQCDDFFLHLIMIQNSINVSVDIWQAIILTNLLNGYVPVLYS